jgi:hypothetical protein
MFIDGCTELMGVNGSISLTLEVWEILEPYLLPNSVVELYLINSFPLT